MTRSLRVEAGTLLAAWPDLLDPNFMHTVVLVCQHTDEGAYGLVTNRTTELVVGDLLPEHELLKASTFPVHLGGPVDHTSFQFVHTVPEHVPGGLEIEGTLHLGGELDALARYLDAEGDRARERVRVFLGYSGWDVGQLDQELDAGSWLWAAPSLDAVFGAPGEETWRKVVRASGVAGDDLQNQPPDVSWN